MVEAARKYQRIVQHGTQCRSSANIREGIQKLHEEGVIGTRLHGPAVIFKLRSAIGRLATSCSAPGHELGPLAGPGARRRTTRPAVTRWRYLKEYGNGEIGDQGGPPVGHHPLGAGLDTHPTRGAVDGRQPRHKDDEDTPEPGLRVPVREPNLLVGVDGPSGTPTRGGHGHKYPFVDHQNVVGVIFWHGRLHDHPRLFELLRLPGRDRKPGPRQRARNPMMDADHFRNWIAGHAEPQAGRYVGGDRGRASLLGARPPGQHLLPHRADAFLRQQEGAFRGRRGGRRAATRSYRTPYVVPNKV